MKSRSELSKAIWRKRRREKAYKALCSFCHKPIWAGGVRAEGRAFHKGCHEASKIGLRPRHIGRNPRRRARRDSYRFYGARPLNPATQIASRVAHTSSPFTFYGPNPRVKCPDCGKFMYPTYSRYEKGKIMGYGCDYCHNFYPENDPRLKKFNPVASRVAHTASPFTIYGPNVTRKRVSKGKCAYCDDPIYAGGVSFRGKKYHETCAALARKGVPAKVFRNPETRPPREFMADMLPGLAASYPRASRAKLGQIASGIWYGFTPTQRRAYRERHAIPNVQYFKVKMNPLYPGERYLGKTKRGLSVKEAKRKGYL